MINKYNNLNLIILYCISLIQLFLMIFNIYYIFVELNYLPWNSLPSAATRKEHYSQSNVVITKKAIPLYKTQYPPYVPIWKEMVKPELVPFRKLEM